MNIEQELNKKLLVLKVVWVAMLLSLCVYLFIGFQVSRNQQASLNNETFTMLRGILYAIAFVILIASRYVRRFILPRKSQSGEQRQYLNRHIFQKYSTATIVALAMSEAPGVYGLVLFFMGRNYLDLFLLLLASAVAMIIYRPKRETLIELLEDGEQKSPVSGIPIDPDSWRGK